MTNQTISTKIRILAPDDGYALTDGTTYTTGTIFLAYNADASKWHEIPISEIPSEDTPKNRIFSKLRIVAALQNAGLWESAKEWIISNGLYDLYLAAQEFAEGNDWFDQGKNELQRQLGLSNEQVEEILNASVI